MIKKFTIIILFILLITCFTSSANNIYINNGTKEKIKQLFNEDVPTWHINDYWLYDIDTLQISVFQSGTQIDLDLSITAFKPEVVSFSPSAYNLDLSGDIQGSFLFDESSGSSLGGKFIFTKMSGTMQVRKTDLAIISGNIIIKSIALITQNPLSLPLLLPLTITVSMDHSSPRPFIDFPINNGKLGIISEVPSNIEIKIESFILKILNIFIPEIPGEIIMSFEFEIPLIPYIINEESVSVQAGPFNAYNIELGLGLLGNMYYAPDAGNIVKLDFNLNIPSQYTIIFSTELVNYNY